MKPKFVVLPFQQQTELLMYDIVIGLLGVQLPRQLAITANRALE